MVLLLVSLSLAAVPLPTIREPLFRDGGMVLPAPTTGPFSGGINAPTVAWDGSQYVMYFESLRAPAYNECVSGNVIGRATSPNGRTWTLGAAEVLSPEPDEFAPDHCSVEHPAVVYDHGRWHLFYAQAGSRLNVSSTVNEPGGIGYAVSEDGVTFTKVDDAVVPPGDAVVGMPSAVIVGDQFYLYYSEYPDLAVATGPVDLSTPWSLDGPVLDHSAQAWSKIWLGSAAAVCRHDARFTLFVGGDSNVRSIGVAKSPDGYSYRFDGPRPIDASRLDINSLRHWDVLAAREPGEFVMWYSKDDYRGKKAVGIAYTTARWGRVLPRICSG